MLIWGTEQALRDANPHNVIRYDPDLHSLAVPEPGQFVTTYKVPVAFSPSSQRPDATEKSFRLVLSPTCRSTPVHDQDSGTWPVKVDGETLSGICILWRKEDADKGLLTVRRKDEHARFRIRGSTYTLLVDGAPIAEYKTASAQRYSPVPLFMSGCTFFGCEAKFYTYHVDLDTAPRGKRGESSQHPAAVLLGIEPYQGDERFEAAARNHTDQINRVQMERLEKEVQYGLSVLDRILSDPQVSRKVWSSLFWVRPFLLQDRGRLTGYAERLVALYLDLMAPDGRTRYTDADAKALDLSRVLALLEPDAFREHGPRIAQAAVRHPQFLKQSVLYLKVSGLGDGWLEAYEADFVNLRERGDAPLLPALALCRIGKANAQIVEAAKKDFLWGPKRPPQYHQALFLLLLRVGEREFVVENYAAGGPQEIGWYERILAGEADTEFGPNRCMTSKWIETSPLPPEMQPVL